MTRRTLALDALLALLVFGMTLAILAEGGLGESSTTRDLDGQGALLAAAASVPLLVRRLLPLPVYAVSATATVVLVGLNYPADFPIGALLAVYTLGWAYGDARLRSRTAAILAVAVFLPAIAAVYAVSGVNVGAILVPELLLLALLLAGAWMVGDRTRLRHERLAEVEERARRAQRETERERRVAAAEERTRIARELHDSAGHAINVILVQAGAARLLQERDPAGSRQAIATIEDVARSTVTDIDRLVRALREDGELEPAPADPGGLAELVAHHRSSGLTVTGDLGALPPGTPRSVAWATYRILQEALTNAARHGSGSANLAVHYGPEAVEITVTNPANLTDTATGGGHGITGMRERAALLGGTLEARPDRDGFRLHARLPLTGAVR